MPAVDEAALSSPVSIRIGTRFQHKPSALHRLFPCACGNSGKPGAVLHLHVRVFQMSSLPQAGFRKLRTLSTHLFSVSSARFPLFLCELRVLRSLILFFFKNIHTRRSSPRHHAQQSFAVPTQPTLPKRPGIHGMDKISTRHKTVSMARIKRKKRQPFPAGRRLL